MTAGNFNIENIDIIKPVTDKHRLNTDLFALQIETCRRQHLTQCPVFVTEDQGTAWTTDGTDLYTCRHIVHNWITEAAQQNHIAIEGVAPALLIKDANGKILYNSATAQNLLRFKVISTDNRINHPIIKWNSRSTEGTI